MPTAFLLAVALGQCQGGTCYRPATYAYAPYGYMVPAPTAQPMRTYAYASPAPTPGYGCANGRCGMPARRGLLGWRRGR